MKIRYWLVLALALFEWRANAQLPHPLTVGTPKVVEAGPHHRVWQTISVDELGHTNISSYTELATGLSDLDPASGLW